MNDVTTQLIDEISYIFIDDICKIGIGNTIYKNYYTNKKGAFRWSMKPVLMNYIIDRFESKKIICVDSDIRFFQSTKFLFDLLDDNHIILSPHFRSSNPVTNYKNFILQYNAGIFNGGFVAASHLGKDAINWWATACSHVCEFNPGKGQFYDQVHLNLIPIYFNNVHILKHRGCNVANWNLLECPRILIKDRVLINNIYPVVFIHFTKSTILGILRGEDKYLYAFFDQYSTNVKKYNQNIDLLQSHLSILNDEKKSIHKNVLRLVKKNYLQIKSIFFLKNEIQ